MGFTVRGGATEVFELGFLVRTVTGGNLIIIIGLIIADSQ